MAQLQLPTFYYHDHFCELLAFVESVCADCMTDEASALLARLRALPEPARCLYIRMANRKGLIFARERLVYPELGDLAPLFARLHESGFARPLTPDDATDLLRQLNRDELLALCRAGELPDIRASWPKAKLLAALLPLCGSANFAALLPLDQHIMRLEAEALDYILFLYFGRRAESLKLFALRDMGLVGTNGREASEVFQSRFDSAAEALFCFTCRQLGARLEREETESLTAALESLGEPPTDYAAACRDRLAYKLGQLYEHAGDVAAALAAYALSISSECRERVIRLRYAAGEKDAVKQLLEGILDDPSSEAEHDFASDFYRRKFGGARTGVLTALLRQGSSITLDDLHRGNPEFGVIARAQADGWDAYYTENHFWHALFGLIFWDELFGADARANNAFDRLPFSLVKGTFWQAHATAIETKLQKIRAGKALTLLLQTIARASGEENGLFDWQYLEIEALTAFLRLASPEAVEAMLTAMAQRFTAYRDGYPDLLLARGDTLKFVEVKATGDSLRRNQLTRMQQLQSAGIVTEICRVDYRFDPLQTYVVVDIETTGSRADHGRITEIGAVKLRGGEIIGEFHSLVNPSRRIPPFITQLTGITDSMVAGAPSFAAIADEFAAFIEGAIFVAHNVNFDYGFIAAAYAREDIRFRLPKFCTCAGMRRYHPGLSSYSLANLCAVFGITNERHHRALADARAAAQLLGIIMDKRQALADDRDSEATDFAIAS